MKSLDQGIVRLSFSAIGFTTLIFAVGWVAPALARPRPPLPPLPEFAGPRLFHEGFDWACAFGLNQNEWVIADYGTLRESWSGYALQRTGKVPPFFVPALDASGWTNVTSDAASAVRFWFTPAWASPSAGGAGPGQAAILCQLVATDGADVAVVWSLQASPDGSSLRLVAEDDHGPQEVLCADIAWKRTAHCLALNFGPDGTALFVDGQLAATGAGTLAVPPKAARLVFGSDWTGAAAAEGDLDEIHVFGDSLSEAAVGFHYAAYAKQAALGPVSAEEAAALEELLATARSRAANGSRMSASPPPPPGGGGGGGEGGLGTNSSGPLAYSLPGLKLTLPALAGSNVTLTVFEGTNGLSYDLFSCTNLLGDSITHSSWTFHFPVINEQTFTLLDQPWPDCFYVLGTPTDSDGDGLTDAFEVLLAKTDPYDPDTNDNGVPDGLEYWGSLSGQQGRRINYTYDAAGRLISLSGARAESIGTDPEGNVQQIR
jgi:hypothetical protein